MKIIFMGTPEFAVPSLKALINEFEVIGVFTQPDKPKGRGKKMTFSPVKEVAVENNIPVYQPINLKKDENTIEDLRKMKPDYIIVVAYGQILPKEVLTIPKFACINLHASLLPKYRGAAPINWAIINGEKESGNTTMLMDVGLDTGDMLLKQKVDIHENMTSGELHDILMEKGAELLVETINKMSSGNITPEKQENQESSYASMLDKKMAKINWNKKSIEIKNLIRGVNPWPVAHTTYQDKIMKVYKADILEEKSSKEPGTIIDISKEGIKVVTGDGVILIEKVQFPGKKVLKVEQYIKGNTIEKDTILI